MTATFGKATTYQQLANDVTTRGHALDLGARLGRLTVLSITAPNGRQWKVDVGPDVQSAAARLRGLWESR